ncbi:MAG TPA: hypothetical protein VK498_04365 [Ferruginibacter sp.]|nr:hypothetical protein [Ferruginibacter sp.]
MKRNLMLFLVMCFSFVSCKKESDIKTCWQLVQNGGLVNGGEICNKTQTEMQDQYGNQFDFFRSSEPRYCWRFNGPQISGYGYARNLPQYIIDKYYTPYSYVSIKINCNSFCNWRMFIRSQSKITGQYQPTLVKNETYLTDTCRTLYVGRIVVVRETTDSLITAEYKNEF